MAKRWPRINFKNSSAALPPPGDYPASISSFEFYDKPDVLWMKVNYGLRDHAATVSELVCIAALPGSQYATRVAEGLRLLNRLAKATHQNITVTEPEAIPALFTGKAVTLTVAHKVRDGIAELVVRGIAPPKTTP